MKHDDIDEAVPMLDEGTSRDTRRPSRLRTALLHILPHLFMILLYSIISLLFFHGESCSTSTSLTPINKLDISYEPKNYTDFELSDYAGLPSPLLDRKWHDLLDNITLRVSVEELSLSNQTSVALPNGGYMAWLGVSHELHCIKMLRQWNYRAHYHPDIKENDQEHWDIHADHCLDILRSAAMCHADTTLTTFRWDEKPKPMLNTKLTPHKCVNWDLLMDSVRYRVVGDQEIAQMTNPLL